jgi:restriction system protein
MSAFELNGEMFDVADIDFEEAFDRPSTSASSLVVEESGRVKQIITDIFQDDKALLRLEPRDFEEVVAELLRSQGFTVELTKRTRDGGYDLIAIGVQAGFPLKFLVECKRYRTQKIGIEIVRNLMYVVDQEQANKGIIATTSFFSRDASDHVKKVHQYRLDLRDKSDILSWVQQYGESILHLHSSKP